MFDVSKQLLMISMDHQKVISRNVKLFTETDSIHKARYLSGANVDLLICGAISNAYKEMLFVSGIQVVPNVCGQVEAVVQAFIDGRLEESQYSMPGCRGRFRRQQRRHGQH